MIEVEKKFKLTDTQVSSLLQKATFLKQVEFTDTYYDDANFSHILKDEWLRDRNGKFQLKVPLSIDSHRLVDQYEEIEDDASIIEHLNLNQKESIADNLSQKNIKPFCKCHTIRKKYQNQEFIIDIDEVNYEDFSYSICEIEILVETESEVEAAIQKILDFSKKHNLEVAPVRGKVVEYIKRKYPDIYNQLPNTNQK